MTDNAAFWLYEDGIGEARAMHIVGGEVAAVRIERSDSGPRAGAIQPVKLVRILGQGRGIGMTTGATEILIDRLPKAVPVANLWIGLAKGVVFGILVALVACHFGLRARPNTESLAANTTASVVTAITVVILVDAVFAVATRGIGVS